MPYKLVGKCVHKQNADGSAGDTVPGGCHDTEDEAKRHMRALYANVKDSGIVEMSMRIAKASYNKTEDSPRRWVAIDSDIDEDLYKEKMSIELYKDFVSRIESKTPVPEPFRDVICESGWCGEMPYLSIAHFKAGDENKNVPGAVESVYVDGTRLKSKGTLADTPMGRKVFDALVEDLYKKKSGDSEHLPVRISIGFLDLEHKHLAQAGGQEFTFKRTDVGQLCPLCVQGVGGKIYTKGQLVHLALTRVPANPRTEMNVERSMDEITTKKQDAESIIGELANELEEKSIANDVLVVRSDEMGSMPRPDPSELTPCYNPNDGGWNQECINAVMDKYMAKMRDSISTPVKSTTDVKPLLDALWKSMETLYKSNGLESPIVEDAMEPKVEVEKATLGGESVPHKPFNYEGINGDGNNTMANPVKAKVEDESPAEDKKGDEKEMPMHKSALDNAFETLKSLVEKRAGVEDVNKAFSELGTAVESAYAPEPKAFDPNDLANIVRSAVEQAVAPLKIEIATLKASQGQAVQTNGNVVKSKALTINGYQRPEDLIARAAPNQPTRKLTQIEKIARSSTGLRD